MVHPLVTSTIQMLNGILFSSNYSSRATWRCASGCVAGVIILALWSLPLWKIFVRVGRHDGSTEVDWVLVVEVMLRVFHGQLDFLWGHVKEYVYAVFSTSIEELILRFCTVVTDNIGMLFHIQGNTMWLTTIHMEQSSYSDCFP